MNKIIVLAIGGASLLLSGCYTPIIEGGQQGYDRANRASLAASAESGDPAEQFKLGNTYCCQGTGPLRDMSIYDNTKATQWYCRAARQGYAPAQLRLARLYSGHPIRGLHLILRISDLMGNDETNYSVALMWASLAADKGEEDAAEIRDAISNKISANARARAEAMGREWKTAPCLWNEVIPAPAKSAAR